jgi:hypothetical protein
MNWRTFVATFLLVGATVAHADSWVVQPVRLPAGNAPSGRGIELKADGSVLAPEGKLLARVAGDELRAPDGSVIVRQNKDDSVDGLPMKLSFTADDVLQFEGGKLYFDPTGALYGQKKGQPAKEIPGMKLPELKGHARRLPLILFLLYYLSAPVSTDGPVK